MPSARSRPLTSAPVAVREAVKRAGAKPDHVERVIMGNVLSAGMGQAPARQCVIKADFPVAVGAITLNKVCGSGLQAVMFARREILVDDADVIVAGGMESMTNAPYLLPKARARPSYGQRRGGRLDDRRRPVGPLRRPPHGRLRRRHGREVRLHARGPGRLRGDQLPARAGGPDGRALQGRRSSRSRCPSGSGEPLLVDQDEEPGAGQHREDGRACARPSRRPAR